MHIGPRIRPEVFTHSNRDLGNRSFRSRQDFLDFFYLFKAVSYKLKVSDVTLIYIEIENSQHVF